MKKIVCINGSPRAEKKTTSAGIIARMVNIPHDKATETHTIRIYSSLKSDPVPDYKTIATADAIIFVFPLYYFCLPGLLMRFLQNYETYCRNRSEQLSTAKVYAIVNCGFPESSINKEAVRVIRCFSRHMNMQYRYSILIGSGPILVNGNMAPAKKAREQLDAALLQIANDISAGSEDSPESILIDIKIPKKIYYFFGGMGWKRQAKQNGLKKDDLYRQPYQK
jgi:multimeric flavodoxin WrbA